MTIVCRLTQVECLKIFVQFLNIVKRLNRQHVVHQRDTVLDKGKICVMKNVDIDLGIDKMYTAIELLISIEIEHEKHEPEANPKDG